MAYVERIRDMITQPLLEEIVRQRTAAGWHLVSLEWRRELPDAEAPTEGAFPEDIPYGLRISEDCKRLELDPNENQAMLQMMEMLVQDFPFSAIVSDLNEKGFRTRDGRRLGAKARMIDASFMWQGGARPRSKASKLLWTGVQVGKHARVS